MDSATFSERTWSRRQILTCEVAVVLMLTSCRQFANGIATKFSSHRVSSVPTLAEAPAILKIIMGLGTLAVVFFLVYRTGDISKFPSLKLNWIWDPPLALLLIVLNCVPMLVFLEASRYSGVVFSPLLPSSSYHGPSGIIITTEVLAALVSTASVAYLITWYLMTRLGELLPIKIGAWAVCTIAWVMWEKPQSLIEFLLWTSWAMIFLGSFNKTHRTAPIAMALFATQVVGILKVARIT